MLINFFFFPVLITTRTRDISTSNKTYRLTDRPTTCACQSLKHSKQFRSPIKSHMTKWKLNNSSVFYSRFIQIKISSIFRMIPVFFSFVQTIVSGRFFARIQVLYLNWFLCHLTNKINRFVYSLVCAAFYRAKIAIHWPDSILDELKLPLQFCSFLIVHLL